MSDQPDRVLANPRALGADVDRLPELPEELAEWIARPMLEDVQRIEKNVQELELVGLIEPDARRASHSS